jgi:phosphotriesterase-related protein
MNRRQCLVVLGVAAAASTRALRAARRRVATVRGFVDGASLGVTLMHEHVLVDFIGAAEVSSSRYDRDEAFKTIVPYLDRLKSLGCQSLVECTPAYLGRDPVLLRRLSDATGLHILTNTGYYGAAQDKFLPKAAFTESAQQLADRWIREHERGIDGTDVKPAFMKISVDAGALSEVDAKIVRAAAVTHRRTQLAIHSHTPDDAAGLAQLDLLAREGVPATAFVWVHAQSAKDPETLIRAAARGAWIELDGIGPDSIERYVSLVERLTERGHLGRLLISQDAGWYRVGEPGGGAFRGYDTLFTVFLPALKARGFHDAQIRTVLIENPRRVLSGE